MSVVLIAAVVVANIWLGYRNFEIGNHGAALAAAFTTGFIVASALATIVRPLP